MMMAAVAPLAARAVQPAQAQSPGPVTAPPATPEAGVTPAEIQRLFDAYTVMQAQEQLQLTETQFGQFLPRMKALQGVRRRHQQERGRILQDLRGMVQQGESVDEAQLKDRIKALTDLDARAAEDLRKAYESLDTVLTPRQQARFRLFEEQMERRKIELLTRARAAARKPS